MKRVIFVLIFFVMATKVPAQSWSSLIDPSRAIDWTSAGFTPPSYTTNCTTQPSLLTGSGNASANATSIQTALASCDSTHNVVNIPTGTYYVAGFTFPYKGKQVVRGAGANETTLISTSEAGCGGQNAGVCMISHNSLYSGSSQVLPPSGADQCLWTGGLSQGSTSLTLSSCGGVPPVGHMLILDQAVDSSDTGGTYICDSTTAASCNYDGSGSTVGRVIGGVAHGQMQNTYVTGVTSLGGGSYTVTISPAIYYDNIRSGQNPGAWWSDVTTLNGLENLTVDGTADSYATMTMYDCYECWTKGVAFLNGARASIIMYQSAKDVIRDGYFYQAQGHAEVSYNIDPENSSAFLIENNIFQQVTMPIGFNNGSGAVFDYNYAVDNIAFAGYTWGIFSSHNSGNNMNLFEGNSITRIQGDDAWGSSANQTVFRNMLNGWKPGGTQSSNPIILSSYLRGFNLIGNVMGQPGYHTQYQTYTTSTTAGTGAGAAQTSIYNLGWGGGPASCGTGTPQTSPYCDPLVYSTMMRWGNWDVVNGTTQWNSTEASPGAVTYMNANFSSSYFSSLTHTLPASLVYSSEPSWWSAGKVWPSIGPDITTGNIGECIGGTYAGSEATSSSQCTGGTLSSTAWASHVESVPAQDCYYSSGGAPDGTGSAISFNASTCYATSPVSGATVFQGIVFHGKIN